METSTMISIAASHLNGARVRNPQGEDLGKIEEIMLDLPRGRVAYVVLSFGGFLGVGNKLFAIPWEALKIDETRVTLNIARTKLENAPGFDREKWPETTQYRWLMDVYDYYGYQPFWDDRTG